MVISEGRFALKKKLSRCEVPAGFYENPANSIGYLARMAFRAFSRALEKRTLPHGVTAAQWRFLRVLWLEEGLTQRELSRRVGLREPTTVIALKGLEKSGFVRREMSTIDRRKTHVHLTRAGKALQAQLHPYIVEVHDIATHSLTDKQIETLRELLRTIRTNLAGETDDEPIRFDSQI